MPVSRRTLLILPILLCIAIAGIFPSSLKALSIFNADSEELRSMASLRGIDTSSMDDEAIRSALYTAENVAYEEEVLQAEEGDSYSLEILSADTLSVLENGSVRLGGNVSVAFALQDGSSRKVLSAEQMIVDGNNSRLSAYGSVSYADDDADAGISSITADAVSFLWNEGSLFVSGGTTSTERSNSEDESVTFYTSGNLLNYRSQDQGLFFRDGYITSNPDTAYSSITADSIALLEGGDMFLSGAYLSIGRVPILYLPFFFFPGSRMVGNPAFGFTSSRGMFLSTTFELFGSYPAAEDSSSSSFTSILKSDNSSSLRSNGIYFEDGEPSGAVGSWAETTSSYFAVLADIYAEAGLSIGYDTSIVLFDKALTVSSASSFILSPTAAGNFFNSYGKRERYYSVNSLRLSASFGSLNLDFPLYSDPEVLRIYGNRLTGFSIDSVFGAAQKFPSTYSSTITSYRATLSGSLYLPSKYTSDILDSLRLSSVRASAYYTWNSREARYDISDITLPSFSASASGTIFSFSSDGKGRETESAEEEKSISYTDYFLLSDPLLYPMYSNPASRSSSADTTGSRVSLTYSLTEDFSNAFEVDMDKWAAEDGTLSSQSGGRFTLTAESGRWIYLRSILTPSYGYTWQEARDNEKSHSVSISSANTLSIPYLGLTYELSIDLYRYRQTSDDGGNVEITERLPSFERDRVRSHSLTLSKAITTSAAGTFTPSLKYVLPPLTSTLEPGLSWRLGDISAAMSWAFARNGGGAYESDDIRLSFGYASTYFTFSFSSLYESALFDRSDFFSPLTFTTSASVRSEDKDYSATLSLQYDGSIKDGEVKSLRGHFVSPFAYLTYNSFLSAGRLESEYLEVGTDIRDVPVYAWKNRIVFSPVISGKFHYDFEQEYSTYLTLTAGMSFKIQEFLDLSFSITTGNHGFYNYYENGSFSFGLLWDDLMKSFDFFGNGRRSTSFNMESVSVELVHYMSDWDLHCKYSAEVVSSGGTYSWVPEVAVYLRWKTLPDLKVDQNWEGHPVRDGNGDFTYNWVSGESNFD